MNPGPIWPCLASFTPSGEVENEAGVVSFGIALTRTRWASWPWLWPWLASSGVPRSGETFNSVAFGCIWLHSCRLDPRPRPYPGGEGICPPSRGCEVPAFAGAFGSPCPRPEHPHPMLRIDLSPMQGEVNTCLRGNDGALRLNDACRQCTGWHGDGAMGICRRLGCVRGSLPRGQASFRGVRLPFSERPHLLA